MGIALVICVTIVISFLIINIGIIAICKMALNDIEEGDEK